MGASFTFPQKMGNAQASKLLYLNKKMSAQEAKQCGFIADVYPKDQLLTTVETELRASLLKNPMAAKSILAFKELMQGPMQELIHGAQRREQEWQQARFAADDHLAARAGMKLPKSQLAELGQLARQRLPNPPDDWTEGWFWTWTGRRCSVEKDLSNPETASNFAGHLVLQTAENKLVAFVMQGATSIDSSRVLTAVLNRDHAFLHSFHLSGILKENDTFAGHALQAEGVAMSKFQSVYSPSRLSFMLQHCNHPDYYCAYAWNVDVAARKLNCCTYFQVWDITRDLPWEPSMKRHQEVTSKKFEMHLLTDQDRKLAMSYVDAPLSRL